MKKAAIICTCLIVCAVSQGALVNDSFEDPALDPGAQYTRDATNGSVIGWFDSFRYTFTQDEALDTHPQTPYGDNWAEMGNGRWIYQQIGTYEENVDYDVTFLAGKRNSHDFIGITVELLAGGDAALAADVDEKRDAAGFALENIVGAIVVASSGQFNPFDDTAGLAEASEQSVLLNTGTAGDGYAVGDPLWLLISRPSIGGRSLIDNVAVNVVPEPATLALLGLGSLVTLRRRRR